MHKKIPEVAQLTISPDPVEGKTAPREAASVIYEPFGLMHNGNPGDEPVRFGPFNIMPEGVPAVVPGAPVRGR